MKLSTVKTGAHIALLVVVGALVAAFLVTFAVKTINPHHHQPAQYTGHLTVTPTTTGFTYGIVGSVPQKCVSAVEQANAGFPDTTDTQCTDVQMVAG